MQATSGSLRTHSKWLAHFWTDLIASPASGHFDACLWSPFSDVAGMRGYDIDPLASAIDAAILERSIA